MGDLTPAPSERRARGNEAVIATVLLFAGPPSDRALTGWGFEPGYLESFLGVKHNQEAGQ